jgi:hypothetical protein
MESEDELEDPTMKPIDVRTMSLMLAGTFLFSAVALGGDKKMEEGAAPRPAPEIQKLIPYVGSWEGDGTLTMDGKTTPVRVRHEWVAISDDWGVQIHETADLGEAGVYRSENFFGFDPGARKLHLFTVSNMQDCHDHAGVWRDNETLQLRWESTWEGKPLVEDLVATFDGPDRYTAQSTTTVGGKVRDVLEITMKRVSGMTSR